MTFGAHKLIHSEPFLDYLYEVWQLLSALYNVMWKIFYIYILGPKLLQWNFLQISQLSIRSAWCAQTFPSIFGLFAIFDRNFAKIVAPPSDEYEKYVVHLIEQYLLKKSCKPHRNRPINGNALNAMLVRTIQPSIAQCSGLGSWPTKNTTFSHLQPARVVRSSPNFAWW